MSPAARVKGSYALMLVVVLISVGLMGFLITFRIDNESLTGTVVQYAILLLFSYIVGVMIWRMIGQFYASFKWTQQVISRKNPKLSQHLQSLFPDWETEIIVVEDERFVALAIGFFRPRIVVSTHVLERFSHLEVKAIMLHERYHCQHHDGRILFLSRIMVDAFGYLPIVKPVVRYYETWKELFADRYAMDQMGTEYYLGNVLFKLAKHRQQDQPCRTAVHFASTTLQYRVLQVLEPEKAVSVPLDLVKPLLRTCSILLLLMIGGDS